MSWFGESKWRVSSKNWFAFPKQQGFCNCLSGWSFLDTCVYSLTNFNLTCCRIITSCYVPASFPGISRDHSSTSLKKMPATVSLINLWCIAINQHKHPARPARACCITVIRQKTLLGTGSVCHEGVDVWASSTAILYIYPPITIDKNGSR